MHTVERKLKELETHLFIEFFFNSSRNGLISEQLVRGTHRRSLLEQYGVDSRVVEFAHDITYNLKRGKTLFSSRGHYGQGFPIRNVMFRILTNCTGRLGYVHRMTTLKNDENGEKYIEFMLVDVTEDMLSEKDLLTYIVHELTHALQDCGLSHSGKRLQSQNDNTGYGKYAGNQECGYAKSVADLLYFFNYFERGAYMAQLASYLREYQGKFGSIRELLDYLYDTPIYRHYAELLKDADFLINNIPERHKQKVLDAANNLSNYDFKRYGDFARYLKNAEYKVRTKLNQLIPKIAHANASMVEHLNRGCGPGDFRTGKSLGLLELLERDERRLRDICRG